MGKGLVGVREALDSRAWWVAVAAIACYQLGITIMNSAVFPLFGGVFLGARDVGTLASAAISLGVYALVSTHPGVLRPRTWMLASAALYAVAVPVMLAGVWLGSAALVTFGVLVRALASAWYGTTIYLSLVSLHVSDGSRRVMGCLVVGWAASYVLELACAFLPLAGRLAAFYLSAFAVMAFTYRVSARFVAHTAASQPASELRVTNPRSFLPYGSALFVTIVLLKASFGFAMTFASVDAAPQATVLACVPALLVACGLLASGHVSLDALYKAAMLCVLAGFLLANPLVAALPGLSDAANVVLRAGGDLTRMLAFMLVACAGGRNPVGALGLALYVCGANSLGSVAGAQLGMLANAVLAASPAAFALLLAGVVFAFVAYNVLSPDVFRLDSAVRRVEAVRPVQASVSVDVLTQAAARLARRLALTPRESEALELLAHGRNTAAIQERMVVSRSTAKTHVRNVYAKLGVHSQQALIDLVEHEAAARGQ